MGLDGVELIMTFERVFKIQIADKDAQEIRTIEEAANVIASHIIFKTPERDLQKDLMFRVGIALKNIFTTTEINFEKPLNSYVSESEYELFRTALEELTDLQIPKLKCQNTHKFNSFPGVNLPGKKSTIFSSPLSQFIDLLAAYNHSKLISPESISSYYEVLAMVKGITCEELGIDIENVYDTSSFTDDFGID